MTTTVTAVMAAMNQVCLYDVQYAVYASEFYCTFVVI